MKKRHILAVAVMLFVVVGCDGSVSITATDTNGTEVFSATRNVETPIAFYNLEAPPDPGATEIFTAAKALPNGFVYLADVIPDVILEIRYYSTYNFVGTRVDDYLSPVAILSKEAANALTLANADLRAQGYAIKIFDAYRPQGAVDHFVRWARDESDILTKEYFYPDIAKNRLIPEKYIAARSGHSKGSTVDLTIIDMKTGKEVDMGSPFDLFGPISHHASGLITNEQANNRRLLRSAMERAGFRPLASEWWHYTLVNEPYPNTFFTFPVK
jgi:D-alanyl-D-alanine dipeptidase